MRDRGMGSGFSWRRGFTLVELLVVMAIILILAGLLFTAVKGATNANYTAVAQQTISRMYVALEDYGMEYDAYPAEELNEWRVRTSSGGGELIDLLNPDSGKERFLFDREYLDGSSSTKELRNPWGIPYYYDLDGNAAGSIDDKMNSVNSDIPNTVIGSDYDNLTGTDGNRYTLELAPASDTTAEAADRKEKVGHASHYVVITADPVKKLPIFHSKFAEKWAP